MSMTTSAGAVPLATGGCRHDPSGADGACSSVYLSWIDAFETGNAEIDALHRELVQACNGLLLLVENEADWRLIVAEARKLVERCIEHFGFEESLLENSRFPRCADHAAEHRRLERKMQDQIDRMEQADGSLREHRDIPRSFGHSLVDVIIRHDLDFRSHLLHQQGR
jgi:hemerythrin-like metal-binding protein